MGLVHGLTRFNQCHTCTHTYVHRGWNVHAHASLAAAEGLDTQTCVLTTDVLSKLQLYLHMLAAEKVERILTQGLAPHSQWGITNKY